MIGLSLALIVKNEEENLDVCLSSIEKYVDEIVVVDTGSSDRTIQVAEKHGARVTLHTTTTNPESFFMDLPGVVPGVPEPFSGEAMLGDFGAARRASFAQARGEFILWLDADDVVDGASHIPEAVAGMRARQLDMGFLAYDYARDDQGRTYYRQWRERIIRRGCADWVNPVHEVLMPSRPVVSARFEGITVVHRRKADRKVTPNRNYKILLRQYAAEKTHDPRTLFYLGQEARWVEPARAAGFYEEYLASSGWPEERAAAHVALGSMLEFGQIEADPVRAYALANREYATAASEQPDNPDGLYGMARIAYLRGRWQDCVRYTEQAGKIGNTDSMLGANPLDRTYRPHVYYNHALSQLGRVEEAITSCKAGLAACPDDPGVPGGAAGMLKHNLAAYESQLAAKAPAVHQKAAIEFDKNEDVEAPPVNGIPADAMTIWAIQLWKQVAHVEHDGEKAQALLLSLPKSIVGDPAVKRMKESTARRFAARLPLVEHKTDLPLGKKSIVIWTGPAPEPWDPTTPNAKGLGGSETAVIEMARELAKLGYRVYIYGDPPKQEHFDGVTYSHHSRFKPHEWGEVPDVFIASRAPWAIEQFGEVRAKVKLLWVHDVNVGPNHPDMERWLYKFDRVLCLSQWHKDFFCASYPNLHPDQVAITRNGIDPARFAYPFGDWDLNNWPVDWEFCRKESNRIDVDGDITLPGGERLNQESIVTAWTCKLNKGHEGRCKRYTPIDQYPTPVLKKTNSLVWSSSPNRGLDMLLHNFKMIRARVPDAELHVYYGFDTWETMARQRGIADELAAIERFKALLPPLGGERDGVHNHGKRPQPEVAAAYMRAKVWPYLTGFTETSCITAMEAQAAGCVPVCSAVGALPETVKHGVLLDNNDPRTPELFVENVVAMLTREEQRGQLAAEGRRWALANLSWKALAVDWVKMFAEVGAAAAADPLSKWKER